ncbi:MAG: type I methionyl aminopeptidase [Elusimicrobia bacterium]|nr:type I methionyl aminopeptidase [Elusimicrobiota bacterium]
MSSDNKNSEDVSNKKQVIELKSSSEIKILRKAGQFVAQVLDVIGKAVQSEITTKYLDDLAEKEIRSLGLKPAFLGYRGFPAVTCISINDELVHGIPSKKRILKEGDIVSIDLGIIYEGFYGDMAATFPVGKISQDAQKLLDVTKESLNKAIEQVKEGKRLGDLSWAVQNFVENSGFSVIRDYVGHGIGRKLHEEPSVPNFGKPSSGPRFNKGLVIAIEPMVSAGDWQVKTLDDGWTVVTEDGKLCAHFEHMVALTEKGAEILTSL